MSSDREQSKIMLYVFLCFVYVFSMIVYDFIWLSMFSLWLSIYHYFTLATLRGRGGAATSPIYTRIYAQGPVYYFDQHKINQTKQTPFCLKLGLYPPTWVAVLRRSERSPAPRGGGGTAPPPPLRPVT